MHNSAAVRLLAADNAPVILALIAEHFPRGTRARPAAEVYELMVTDFEVIANDFAMPRTPQSYCTDWVKAGWLVRKSGKSSHGETLEPSEDALSALEAIERWESPVSAVTASRVESISSALQRLARDTNKDIASRVASLEAERNRIDQEIEKARLGQFESLTSAETEERVQDVLNMATAVPSDFARGAWPLLVIDRAEIRITVEARSDAFSTIKPVLIIKSGLDFCTNKGIGTHL
ncbi:DUF3375 family protein [Corynebacterium marquesiae]|nr:DUF3375 family protein [Corynebacterium marquesiae]MDK8495720.1 DUF3375 family protein [Corynebacterium marquesiae]